MQPIICDHCGTELTEGSSFRMDEEILCETCSDEETVVCGHCDTRIWTANNAGDDDIPICQRCHDYHYTNCERCGTLIANEDAHYADGDEDNEVPYCRSCYDRYDHDSFLHGYSYKPEPCFYGEGIRYLGVELEIDEGGKSGRNAAKLCNVANDRDDHIYIKTDGSLEDGLEIVTHPMTLEYHQKTMPWQALQRRAWELDYTSHSAETCGLHVHVNRTSFSTDYGKQEECISRVLYFMERFWTELLRFSRRTEAQLKRWANRYGYKERPADILDTAKSSQSGRYTCVNITNYDTIEFRIFRGTLKYNTLIATSQRLAGAVL